MIKRMRHIISMVLLVALVSLGMTAQAQRRSRRSSQSSVRSLIHRVEDHTDLFRNSVSAAVAQTGIDSTGADNDINLFVSDFSDAVRRLHERYDRREATAADAQEILNRASLIDNFMVRNRLNASAQRDWSNLRLDLNQLARAYNVSWSPSASTYPPYGQGNVGQVGYGTTRLTGTYRLDTSRSDDPREAADRATRNLPDTTRQSALDALTARLETPDMIAIDQRGRDVTIASSRAPQIRFRADGTERTEQTADGHTARVRATLYNDQLVVSSTGDRDSDFSVTFDPIDNGRRLRITRRISDINLDQPVVVQSIYEKTSDAAQFNIYNGGAGYPNNPNVGPTNGDFIIPDNTTVVAALNDNLSTARAREGDRFTMTVQQPSQYDGAVIDGHVTQVQRSGRVSGRSTMTLNFDSIRLRDGGTYRFAGTVDTIRTPRGDTVRVDNEGTVRDPSQTTKTEERAAIGTAVGAIIGAIAGGGKGAAIGAIVGAGGGAGSVYVQGRDDLELPSGTQVTIRASAPR